MWQTRLEMIKWALNHIPRGMLQRVSRWVMPLVALWLSVGRGRRGGASDAGGAGGVECPLCGGRFRRFMPYGYVETRGNALCPRCLALERHRLLWLWLEREGKLAEMTAGGPDGRGQKFLHIAPEVCLSRKFERLFSGLPAPPRGADRELSRQSEYITADLESPLARVKMDVQAIPFANDTFDVVFCNHVLEHVEDDRLAMREMYRVTRPGGWGVMLSPVELSRENTFEDDTIVDPVERTRVFGQYDHRRVYGRDYADRLREAGWNVEEIDYLAALSPSEARRFALRREMLYVVKKTRPC